VEFLDRLTILGIGWNFAFIGRDDAGDECTIPHERNKVQAFNDLLVFGSMALGSFSSGALLARFGLDRGERHGISGHPGGGPVMLAWGSLVPPPDSGLIIAAETSTGSAHRERIGAWPGHSGRQRRPHAQ